MRSYTITTMMQRKQVFPCIVHAFLILTISYTSLNTRCMAYTRNSKLQRCHQQPSFVRHVHRPVPSGRSTSLKCSDNKIRENELLQQLIEPFDRWRYLQKLLDEDINDASEILFIFRTFVLQQLQQKQPPNSLNMVNSGISPTSLSLQTEPIKDVEASDLEATSSKGTSATRTEALSLLSATTSKSLDYDENYNKLKRRKIMEYIVNDVTSDTLHNLIQILPNTGTTDENDVYFLDLLEQLLPQPEHDEDAAKGLWDTIIELHGRESVKINERTIPQNKGWKTRCLIARLLIYYDFLTDGLNPTR